MPKRLRPKTRLAPRAILVGDPGRSLLLAQELLEEPRMSNHARGLWGYSGRAAGGRELTIQATGMGGPSAALVLADLAKLGVRAAVRVGTCIGLPGRAEPGELLLVSKAIAAGGSATSFGLVRGAPVAPSAELRTLLRDELDDEGREAVVASLDTLAPEEAARHSDAVAADMQTAALLARGNELGLAMAAVLVVTGHGEEELADEALEQASIRAGECAARVLSNPQVEG